MSKYQESLDVLKGLVLSTPILAKDFQKDFDTLQELIDKYDKIKYPRLIPCKCGYNRRHVYYNSENGWNKKVITYECMKCHKKVSTQGSESNAIRHWNEVMKDE